MLLLLDTHILLALADEEPLPPALTAHLRDTGNALFASVASLWEVAIKFRLGKLPLPCPLARWPNVLTSMAVATMDLTPEQAIAEPDPPPPTKDPFDKILLAICHVENMRLVTLDRALIGHPLSLGLSLA